jgi:hypothetical protein
VDFFSWSPREYTAQVYDLRAGSSIPQILAAYGSAQPQVLRSVLAQAIRLGAQMCVVEYRYIDQDYRDEHSRFYSTTFRRYPSVAHRLHFFEEPPPAELFDPDRPLRQFNDLHYLGYSVLRPVAGGPVGRTMLRVTDDLEPYVPCVSSDSVNLLGRQLTVSRATPFMAQDAQLSRCAHTTVWTTAYYHHLRFRADRKLPGDIVDAAPSGMGVGRRVPSAGLSIYQLTEAFSQVDLPCLVYQVNDLPPSEDVHSVVCRYLNSGLPVTVAAGGHAFVLIGYRTHASPGEPTTFEYIRQDDEVGPYQLVPEWRLDDYRPWQFLIVPLPRKVYVAGEKAEVIGGQYIQAALARESTPECAALSKRIEAQEVSLRSTLRLSNEFKCELDHRGTPPELAALYERMSMSRWIWVVEATDRSSRNAGEPCVLAEAIIDATDHLRDLHALAWRIPGRLFRWDPDWNAVGSRKMPDIPPLRSCSLVSSVALP